MTARAMQKAWKGARPSTRVLPALAMGDLDMALTTSQQAMAEELGEGRLSCQDSWELRGRNSPGAT